MDEERMNSAVARVMRYINHPQAKAYGHPKLEKWLEFIYEEGLDNGASNPYC